VAWAVSDALIGGCAAAGAVLLLVVIVVVAVLIARNRRQAYVHTHTHTHTRTHAFDGTALFRGLPGRAGTRKVKPIWILLKHET